MKLTGTIREIQTVLGVTVDGIAGPETWTAIHRRVVGRKTTSPTPPFSCNTVDSRMLAKLRARKNAGISAFAG